MKNLLSSQHLKSSSINHKELLHLEEEYNNKKRQINLKKALAFIFVLCIIIFVESIDFIENLIRKQPKSASHSSHSFQPTLQDYTSARPKHRKIRNER